MRNDARTIVRDARVLSLDWMFRRYQSVTVTVLDGRREVDSFRASSPWLLRAALQPIYRHLRPKDQTIRFSGAEERWLPGGFLRTRTEEELPSLTAALAFLSGPNGQ
jgi:hypothetical protein